jgi:ParB-like chromosome segregation protein Spo0J
MDNSLKIEYIPIEDIKPYKNNAKLHPKEQIQQIKNSILEFGFKDPIAIWNDTIVEGHGRLLAAQELGYKELPVIRLDDLTDEQRKAYTLAHNKLTMNSDFDLDILTAELDDITDIDMSDFGFDLDYDIDEEDKLTKEANFDDSISVVIECNGEAQAEEIYNKLTEEGYVCRISTL